MKKYEHQYVTGMVTGALVALIVTLLSYWVVNSISQGVAVATLLVLVSCSGMIIGAVMSYLVSNAEEGPHFVLKKR